MNVAEQGKRIYIGYEYQEIVADQDKVSFLIDGYESFGWEIDENLYYGATIGTAVGHRANPGKGKTVIPMKRNRKIVNKVELTRLQRHYEACLYDLERLEHGKTSAATMWALIIGVIGTIFMAGAVFAIVAQPPHVILCIVLAIPAFAGWILPYFVYRTLAEHKTAQLTPLIEEKYDEIYALCERGSKLLY